MSHHPLSTLQGKVQLSLHNISYLISSDCNNAGISNQQMRLSLFHFKNESMNLQEHTTKSTIYSIILSIEKFMTYIPIK